MVASVKHFGLVLATLGGAAVFGACGGAPEPRTSGASAQTPASPLPVGNAHTVPGDCDLEPGKPPPAPLERVYTGVAAKARCQREVYSIMGGVTHFLGVKCDYCHLVPDYRAMTHRKEIANWMAAELVPALARKSGGELWCADCHASSGQAAPKILGDPRSQAWA